MPKKTVNYFYKKVVKENEKEFEKKYKSNDYDYGLLYEEYKKDETDFVESIKTNNTIYNLCLKRIEQKTRVKYSSELQNKNVDLLCERCMNDKEIFKIVYITFEKLIAVLYKYREFIDDCKKNQETLNINEERNEDEAYLKIIKELEQPLINIL
jgi:hypothetical protein